MNQNNRFCLECSCTGEPQDFGGAQPYIEENWYCPLLNANICQTCCQIELAGGMGASDTLKIIAKQTRKSPSEIHAICVACDHGGKDFEEPPDPIGIRDSNGKWVTSGVEFLAKSLEIKKEWMADLKQLKSDRTVPRT